MQKNLTQGPVGKTLLLFSLPMIVGNLLQQLYNIADTLIVGRFLGSGALAAVGSSYTLMTFLTSVFLGLCMGSGAVFSIRFGEGEMEKLQESITAAFLLIWTLVCFAHWSFSLIRKMEMGETIIHPLCGCASIVIQKNYLSVHNKVVQAIL